MVLVGVGGGGYVFVYLVLVFGFGFGFGSWMVGVVDGIALVDTPGINIWWDFVNISMYM